MALEPGQTLAHYRIERKIGEGGMGEVWAATDTRLNRTAAIKALPAALAAEPEKLARFKREAQLLAALSHPNIAGIYGLEQADGASYLALEFVEGDELMARMDGQRVPIDETVEIALQIAAALEEAHEKGIIHRDLKPANIKITPDGKAKVLDFGLAKALSEDPGSSVSSLELSASPTLTAAMGTQVGVILGTASYMSPEQARGKKVDRRADIWAFGVILFEMLTGERMFTGETVTDVIAQVVTREPEWDKLPESTPVAMRRVLRRCLQKDPRKRLRDIGDAALELGEESDEDFAATSAAGVATPERNRRAWLLGVAGIVLGLVLAMAARSFLGPGAAIAKPTWSNLSASANTEYDLQSLIEISPDGRRVVFVASSAQEEEPLLWVRDLDQDQSRPLAGTEDAYQPFWSPDSQSIGYFAKGKLRRISADGGASKALADAGSGPRGACWGRDGTILFVPDWSEPVYRIPDSGGTPEAITEFNVERFELSHRWPHFLPDGKHFLFYVVSTYPKLNPDSPSEADQSGLYVGSLDGDDVRFLHDVRSRVVYTHGSLMYVDDGVLTVRPFDLSTLSFDGEPVSIAEKVTQTAGALWGGALFSVSNEGTLLFARGVLEQTALAQLKWFDRKGNEIGQVGGTESYNDIRLSNDGDRLVASIGDPGNIWIYDLQRETSTLFTFDPGNDDSPIWSPEDERIFFQSSRVIPGQRFSPGNLFQKLSSGAEDVEHLAVADLGPRLFPTDWSPDGTTVVLNAFRAGTGSDLMLYSFEAGTLEQYLGTPTNETAARFSPEGRWLAYQSDESGRYEIYVRAFAGSGGKWQISTDGGTLPVWRADGKELFYAGPDSLMAVTVETQGRFRHGTPVGLLDFDVAWIADDTYSYDVASDGQSFLILEPVEDPERGDPAVTLVQGWRTLLD
jgi:serine/threonine protein kinase/Tol biopolymer transport system component